MAKEFPSESPALAPPSPKDNNDADVRVTCVAPVNIAVIKYWGKRDTERILPTNSSLSVTLDTADLHSRTTVHLSPEHDDDRMWLNGEEESLQKSTRIQTCLRELRAQRKQREDADPSLPKWSAWNLHIQSVNNFPTAAGLASSASGLACLAYTIACAYQLVVVTGEGGDVNHLTQLSKVARMGSGSACRSIFGGYVKWEAGERADGEDSIAVQVAPRALWPDMKALILVVNDAKKTVSSTAGMQTTVQTSTLFRERVERVVPERMRAMEQAILNRDFRTFATLTMQDSNQFHAVCLDTFPPISYLNDTSKKIIQLVHAYNERHQELKVAYTYDAGPNAVLYILEQNVQEFVEYLLPYIQRALANGSLPYNAPFETVLNKVSSSEPSAVAVENQLELLRIIYTGVGDGPKRV